MYGLTVTVTKQVLFQSYYINQLYLQSNLGLYINPQMNVEGQCLKSTAIQ